MSNTIDIEKYYAALGLTNKEQSLTPQERKQEIKAAYKKLSLIWHPDKWSAPQFTSEQRKIAEENFKILTRSFDVLVKKMDETQAEQEALRDEILKLCAKNWKPETYKYKLAFENLTHNPTILNSMAMLVEKKIITYSAFASSDHIHPLIWQLLENKVNLSKCFSYSNHVTIRFIASDIDSFTTVCSKKSNTKRDQLTSNDILWLVLAARQTIATKSIFNETPYFNDLKWDLLYDALPDYISSKGEKNETYIANILNVLSNKGYTRYGSYLHSIYEKIILPIQEKIAGLKDKKGELSQVKAEQLNTALATINNSVRESIMTILDPKNKEKKFDDSKEARQIVHNKVIETMTTLITSDKINEKKNTIRDLLRTALGAIICLSTIGLACASKRLRHAFFHTETRAKVENAKDEIVENYLRLGG